MRAAIPTPASGALLALLAVVTSTAGCATKGDLRNLQTELREVSARQEALLAELRQQRSMTVDTLGSQSRQLTNLQARMVQQLRDIGEALDRLTELAGQNSRDISAIRDQMVAARRPVAGPGMTGSRAGGDPMSSASPDSLYDVAYQLYVRGSLSSARLGFNQFLEQYPGDELAPKVHANLADILVQERRLEDAIEKFLVIPQDFPNDPEVPNALYRVGVLYAELDDEDEARRYLRMVINTYPDDPMAELAQDRLDELGG